MSRTEAELLAEFNAGHASEERAVLARALLAEALWEAPCACCGRTAFAAERAAGWSRFECPECHGVTWVGRHDGALAVLSGSRRRELLREARRRAWYCPEHDGTRVRVVAVESDPLDPSAAVVRYVCRRSRGWFRSARAHTGVIRVSLLAME
ncbi:MAG: hypothetical protein FJ222_05420 [Lentisphaerae bacterium]|nr:hypothetical protein [Lentisphaerota bacterium]